MQETETKPIRILGISGSPRNMATDFLVQEALKIAKEKYGAETDYFSSKGKKLNFCIHCDFCVKKKEGCVHKDDIAAELYDKMIWADAWIIGTPVYQGTVSAQTKTIMDRCRAVVARDPKVFLNKVGMGIADGGDRIGGQEPAIQTILNFYVINEMIPVGGGSFGANLGGTFWSKDKGAEGVSEDSEGMRSLKKTLKRLIQTALLVKTAASVEESETPAPENPEEETNKQ
ncbi:Fe-S cluster protein [Methanosarcina sp. 2.H.T.1A.6]|uniref:flavodoxin family protein n=1 Tax=unclassified Methanosarcina TaxID=2644672 RepID=UPI0006214B4F|nr:MULTISPECIES: flavodoxin family protein [unclassified Methanosarcina]KKG18670.1 Fe-S cluster protein [Methanosarcina sp. 2.H.T.1A.3]KKG21704.1 Fe-S cluster protein [Methanosarcina sp. 2.H.T.1A.6]KKG23594.1 Fe-S cluster protein [Methanosarcina sp. 2.H.T.1A.15]KKG23699.1 Fe-S cluster protein [Methanosarcina sp. 2.H.T.1A.8]